MGTATEGVEGSREGNADPAVLEVTVGGGGGGLQSPLQGSVEGSEERSAQGGLANGVGAESTV